MLTTFINALHETLLILLCSTFLSIIVSIPLSYMLITSKVSANKLVNQISEATANIFQALNYIPFLVMVLIMFPIIQHPSFKNLPQYLIASMPLALVGAIVISTEMYKLSPGSNNELIRISHKYKTKQLSTLSNIVLPLIAKGISPAIKKTMILLVGLTTIEGAIGFGGLGQLVLSENIDTYNISLLMMTVTAFIAISVFIEYTFKSFTGDTKS